MNNERRSRIKEAIQKLESLVETMQDVLDEVESIKDDEEVAFEGYPENLQYSEKGEAMQEAMGSLDDAMSELESAKESIDEAVSALESAEEC